MENVIHRAVLLATGPEIAADDVELTPSDGPRQTAGGDQAVGVASLVGRRMDDVERDLIIETLGHTSRQSHPRRDDPGHFHPCAAQQTARLHRARRRRAAARRECGLTAAWRAPPTC